MGYFPLEFSDHARQKMALRAVSKEEVFRIIRNPEVIHRSDAGHTLMCGNLSVILATVPVGRWRVVTVLLREQKEWGDDAARSRNRPTE
jgi:peptide deformylase